ncbi:MAG: heme biosynthesis HemY N-terminal domain-containing protein [Pseudomonadota bacterium]|jgi:HemY protein
MRVLIWLLALFALAVGLSLAAGYNEGYVLLVLPPYRVELSLNFFVVLLLAVLFLGYLALRTVVNTLRLPESVRRFREAKRREKAAQAFRDAVQNLFEGRYGHALKNAALAYEAGEARGLAALIAARAARAMRDDGREREWLERAAEHDRDVHVARLLITAKNHTDARRFDEAAQALETLNSGGQRHIAGLRLGLRIYRALNRWTDVVRIARLLEKHRALAPEPARLLKLRAHLESLRAKETDAKALVKYWDTIPAAERRVPQLAREAARALIAAGDGVAAQCLIEEQLEAEWDSGLAELYGQCRGGDMVSRIARAEKWLAAHPNDARLLLALGRMCRSRELWGKAQSYFEASLALEPTQAGYAELATLMDYLGRTEEANRLYRRAAELCSQAAPPTPAPVALADQQ